jgi:hypothetical protein
MRPFVEGTGPSYGVDRDPRAPGSPGPVLWLSDARQQILSRNITNRLMRAEATRSLQSTLGPFFCPWESIWPSAGRWVTPEPTKRSSESDFDFGEYRSRGNCAAAARPEPYV